MSGTGIRGASHYGAIMDDPGLRIFPGNRVHKAVEEFLKVKVRPEPFVGTRLYFTSRQNGKSSGNDEMSLLWDSYENRLFDWNQRERRALVRSVPRRNYYQEYFRVQLAATK